MGGSSGSERPGTDQQFSDEIERSTLIAALDATNAGLAVYDAHDRLVAFNRRYAEIRSALGEANSAAGRTTRFGNRNPPSGKVSGTRRVPNGRWYRVNGKRLPGGGTVAVWSDVTDLMREGDELEAELRHAKHANAAALAYLYNVAHELRSPLTAILGFAELITSRVSDPANDQRHVQYAENIKFSANHLLFLSNTLLDVGSIESGTLELDYRSCDVDEFLETAIVLVRPQSDKKGIAVHHRRASPSPRCSFDERRIRQVMVNLLSNAIKFTPVGGVIEVAAAIEDGDALSITVRDTGVGMAPEDIARVMVPFDRLTLPRAGHIGGVGLGLALSKAIVEAHQGQLMLESTPGLGTTAIIRLPGPTALATG